MAGKIPQHFIDDLLARADIVEVIDSRVKLRKTGKNYSACCPFHDEKTPSFTVSPDKQFFYCFGCGANGNAIGFLMEYDRMGFPEAVEKLAGSQGLEVPREQLAPGVERRQQENQSLYQLTEKAADFYRTQLRSHPAAGRAITYLKQRGLSGEIARDFGIGLAPPGWDNLLDQLADTPDKADQLERAGLAIRRQDSNGNSASRGQPGGRHHYDRFRNRIMFPIRDQRGRTIAFGGRVLGDDKPKYLNSPETPIFHKSRELYGLWEARQANRDLQRLIVVEGYMDVVALAQFGIRCAVATLGTACGEDHIQLAFRHTGELVFCFDGDRAGRSAAQRALEAALPNMQDGRSVRFLLLPEGEDPDTLVRQLGGERFSQLLDEQARPLEDFLFDLVGEGINLQTMDGRARLSKLAAPLLDQLPAGVYRQLMFQQLAARTGLDREMLEEIIEAEQARRASRAPEPAAASTRSTPPQAEPAPRPTAGAPQDEQPPAPEQYPDYDYPDQGPPPDMAPADTPAPGPAPRRRSGQYRLPPERMLIALLLHHPELAAQIDDTERFRNHGLADLELFAELVELLKRRPDYNLNQLLGYWRAHHGAESGDTLAQLATSQLVSGVRQLARGDAGLEYDPKAEFRDCLQQLERADARAHKRGLLEQLRGTGNGQLSDEQRALLANWKRKQD